MMNKAREFDNILDECLDRVIKGETLEQCLAGYPEHAEELEPLLRTALVAKEATAIKPRPEFRERASYQFQAAIREIQSKKSRGLFGWQPRWATALIVLATLLLAGSGTVAAASNSMPDEPLYQVKLATEAVRLTLTPSALGKAELYIKLADKRVDEIIKMADKGKAEQVERTAQRLNTELIAMANLTVPGGKEPVEIEVSTSEAALPQAAEEAAPLTAPVPAPVPAPEPAPTIVPREAPVTEEAPAPQAQLRKGPVADAEEAPRAATEEAPVLTAPEVPAPTVGSSTGKAGGKSPKPDKQAELKEALSRRATENQEALRAVLGRAPESVKPALQQAIEVASASYEQALRNLE